MMMSDRTMGIPGKQDEQYAGAYAYHAVPQSADAGAPVPPVATGLAQAIAGIQPAASEQQPNVLARDLQGLLGILCSWLNIMLAFVPLGIISFHREWGALSVFTFNFLAIVPLASILGQSTECLAVHVGQMMGGLLNATFGNAVEMIVTVNAIKAGLVDVVQGSLLGSILSNLLLVLGMAFFAAGVVTKESSFNATGASANMTCLSLGSVALALPTVFDGMAGTSDEDVLSVSRISSAVIICVYVMFIIFQLGTHSELFSSGEEEEEEVILSAFSSILLLLAATVCVAVNSEYLVDSIEGVSEDYGLPQAFIGVILLPIVGNAAEHATAVTVAAKGKMDLALGVAVGSSTQIALLVVPFSVIVGWCYEVPMSLNFRTFDAAVLVLSVMIAMGCLRDGKSNWLEGAILMAIYVLVAIMCWFVPEQAYRRL